MINFANIFFTTSDFSCEFLIELLGVGVAFELLNVIFQFIKGVK